MISRATLIIAFAGFGIGAVAVPVAEATGLLPLLNAASFARPVQADEPDPTLPPVPQESADPFSSLYKIDGKQYRVAADDGVSLKPLGVANVRKVGYGHVTDVRIVTTATGTYSTDGMTSHHVLYPGISVEAVDRAAPGTGLGLVAQKLVGGTWIGVQGPAAGSFIHFGGDGRGSYVVSGDTVCVLSAKVLGCS